MATMQISSSPLNQSTTTGVEEESFGPRTVTKLEVRVLPYNAR